MFDHNIVVHNKWEHLPIYTIGHMVGHKLRNFVHAPKY